MKIQHEEVDRKPASISDVSILVVDDDRLITRLVVGAMKVIGITNVIPVNDPHQALDFVAEGLVGIDLVLCDMVMPEVDGLEILRVVRKSHPEMPFLMLTADGTSGTVSKAVELGVTSYMIKPFAIDELQSKVRQLIGIA